MTQSTPEQPREQPQNNRVWLISTAVAVLAIVAYVVVSLTGGQSPQAGTLQNVSVQDLASAQDAFLLDVREPWEFEQGHAPGATLIPLGQLAGRIDELPDGVPIYVMCRSGNRSLTASDMLVAAGKQDVRNVRGGILAWQQAALPIVR